MSTQQDNAQDHNIPAAGPGSGHAQDSNAESPSPTIPAQQPAEPVTIGPVKKPGHRTPGLSTAQDPTTVGHDTPEPGTPEPDTEAPEEEDEPTGVDPHEVRARLAVHGSAHGLELDTGSGVVFIPQHALPDLRRRLYLAQQRFTAMSGPVPGKRRRRPASAR